MNERKRLGGGGDGLKAGQWPQNDARAVVIPHHRQSKGASRVYNSNSD